MKLNSSTPIKSLLFLLFFVMAGSSMAQMTYSEFRSRYSPHNEPGIDPKNEGVKAAKNMSPSELGMYLGQFIDENNKDVFMNIITSIPRDHAGKTIDAMVANKVIRGLNWMKDEWVREVMWYVSEPTYNKLAPYVTAISDWNGVPEGTSYKNMKAFQPMFAGLGYDIAWGGFRGVNKWIEGYNSNTSKTAPDGSTVMLDPLMNNMHWNKGIGVYGGLYLSKKTGLDVSFSHRGATAEGILGGGSYTRVIKYAGNYIGLGLMNHKHKGKFDFYRTWGLNATMGSLQKRLDVGSSKGDYEKIDGKYFSAGIYWKYYIQYQPSEKLPLMISINPYFNLNFMKQDFSGLNTSIPNNFTGDLNDLKSGVSNIGAQLSVAWNFRVKKKPEPVKDLMVKRDNTMNTIFDELNPIVSPDGKTIYYSRNNDIRNTSGTDDSQDMWMADVSNGVENAPATHLGAPFNKLRYNYMAGITPDENTIMISGAFKNGEMKGKGYSLTYRTKDGWSSPEMMVIDGFQEMCLGDYAGASLSNDGKHLVQYFSEKKDPESYDLYVSHLKDDGTWTRPKKLGNVNTSDNEMSPFLASDGVTLYFSSNRSGGLGNNDIYVAKRLDDTWQNWSAPVNMGPEVNSDKWDAYYTIDAQGKYAYKVSYEHAGMGSDIVRIKLKEEVQPDPVVLVKGRVLNAKTKEPLEANVAFNSINNNTQSGIARTNPSTGEYKIVLPYGSEYSFLGSAKNFVAQSNNIDLNTKGEYREIEMDILLYPIEVGSTIRLNNIFFETGKATLDGKSTQELDRLVRVLEENPNMEIEVSGHTDNVGSADLNKKLSADRAAAVVTYLTSKGISKSRLKSSGYGMERPVADNATDEGKAMNRRVEFTITKN
ncbi:MAG: OmpA family protein [Flavobacteriales bacterium]|nr:OmpA family protein [Flavobacteriales bacterium]